MHTIRVSVRDHKVTPVEADATVVSGTVGHWLLEADFDGEWDGLSKRVTFSCGGANVTCPYEDGMAVPWEVMRPGALRLGFTGVGADGVEVVRTERMRDGVRVSACGPDIGADAEEATEDVAHLARRRLEELPGAVGEEVSRLRAEFAEMLEDTSDDEMLGYVTRREG